MPCRPRRLPAPARGLAKEKSRRPLRILVLGGTKFIGVHIVELALQHGHTVTLFNRGKTNADIFPQLVHLKGDRDAQLNALKGKHWDAVIDDSGYVPRHVRLSAELLAPNVKRYIFISTISVYASFANPNTEDSPVGKIADETTEKVDGGAYGPLKALCEKAAEKAMPGRVAVVRPGLIVGPRDPTDRFTYWPARAARGGEMVAPDKPSDRVQFIDARDLAAFVLRLVERETVGTFNATSPPGMFTIGDVVSASIAAADATVKPSPAPSPVWVPADFLAATKSAALVGHAGLDPGGGRVRRLCRRQRHACIARGSLHPARSADRQRHAGVASAASGGGAREIGGRPQPRARKSPA